MGKTTAQNIRLGIFVILGTILLVIAAYLIGNRQNMFGDTFQLSAVFKNANGLQNGNNVRFSGINVGTVNRIEMLNDTTIKVHMVIDDKMRDHIKKDAVAMIGSDGLVGSMLVNIVPNTGDTLLVEPGDQLQSYSKIATQDMLSTLNTTNENAALLTAELLKVSQSLTQGKGTLGRLLNDTAMANDLQHTNNNLKHTSGQANSALSELNKIMKSIDFEESVAGVLLTDSLSAQQVQNIITNLETSSTDLKKIVKNLDALVADIDEGKGALRYLTQDTVLVDQLENTMKNIDQGVERFNQNMEALKHNFLTRRYFKKLEKEKEKENRD
ncbi:MlaD family protein [Flagellimonas lutaonensis]|uniref:ABC transporter permease n=1 Tax=Flagellimonas lutaonensis TaxID=516051 RepID=A0A0D5YPX7_9FLAO|nr:MlaD family protein [Allomuricauda lutaonensis]AKA34292.1 ABC transporter permease [Allomuricauda lutaonensis]